MRCTATSRTTAANDGPMDILPASSISAPDLPRSHCGDRRVTTFSRGTYDRFERRVTIAFVVTDDAVLIQGVFTAGKLRGGIPGPRVKHRRFAASPNRPSGTPTTRGPPSQPSRRSSRVAPPASACRTGAVVTPRGARWNVVEDRNRLLILRAPHEAGRLEASEGEGVDVFGHRDIRGCEDRPCTFSASSPSSTSAETISLMFRKPDVKHLSAALSPKPMTLASPGSAEAKDHALHEATASSSVTPDVVAKASVAMTSAGEKARRREDARLQGYTGHSCPECGNFTLARNGNCLKCATCGATTGCS